MHVVDEEVRQERPCDSFSVLIVCPVLQSSMRKKLSNKLWHNVGNVSNDQQMQDQKDNKGLKENKVESDRGQGFSLSNSF